MIDGLKPYSEYKDSGAEWVARIPSHWNVRPAFGAYAPTLEKNFGMQVKTVLSLSYGRIVVKPQEKLHGLVPESFETYQIVNPGDIVIRTTDLQNDHTSLRVGMVRDRGIITSAYLALRTKDGVDPIYGYQFLNVWDTSKAIYGYGSGLRQNLDFSHFKRMPVLVPPREEQTAIVRFLDNANRRIERYIRAKKKLIALLNEQKQAIIHRAVTRGLDPNVRLKPSGIPWLGDIPEHWNSLRVKQCAYKISKGTTPSTEGRAILESGPVRFIKAENVSGGKIVDTPLCFIDEETNKILLRSQLRENDVLFVIAGATLGKIAIVCKVNLPANSNQAVAFIRPNKRVNPTYLGLWLQSPRIKELIWLNAVQSAQPNLSMSDLGNFVVPVPPIEEQSSILKFTSAEVSPIQDAITRTEREIALIREYRTRLVADVVTGQVDVRAAAAKLPAETRAEDVELVEESTGDEGEPSEFEDLASSGTIG